MSHMFVMAAPKYFPCADWSTTPRTTIDWDVFPFQLSFRLKMGGFMFSGPHLVDDIDSIRPTKKSNQTSSPRIGRSHFEKLCKASNHLTFQSFQPFQPQDHLQVPRHLVLPAHVLWRPFPMFPSLSLMGKYSFAAVAICSPLRGHHSMLKLFFFSTPGTSSSFPCQMRTVLGFMGISRRYCFQVYTSVVHLGLMPYMTSERKITRDGTLTTLDKNK